MNIATGTRRENSDERPVKLTARRDLIAAPMEFRGRRYWHLKDPVSLRYYQLREEEHFVWGLLNGQHSLREILTQADARFSPRRLTAAHLYSFLALLHREGLAVAVAADQGERLLERAREKRRDARLAQWTNPLAIRFRGVNPDRALGWLSERLSWLFHPLTMALIVAGIVLAGVTLVPRWSEFTAAIPNVETFFRGENLLWLAVALALVKITHELAHGLACKRFGAECTELGVLLLVLTPCLYCNVTDAWTLPNKWQRILVSAAGMLAELALASLATLVWAWTEPGALNSLAVRVVLICSVGTLLLNGNPLLRYDGYYVLADWLEIPNLQTRATEALRRRAARLLLGTELKSIGLEPAAPSLGLALYGLASLLYRIALLAGIIWFLYSALVQNGFRGVAGLFLVATIATALAQVGQRAFMWSQTPRDAGHLPWTRRTWIGLAALVGLPLLLFVPLPCRVSAPAVLRARDQSPVYATVAGQMVTAVAEGSRVDRDAVLAELSNRELSREMLKLTGQRAIQVQQVANLRRQQLGDPQFAAELLAAEATLEAIDGQLAEQKSLQERLTIKSPRAGVVIPPPARNPSNPLGTLPAWTGTPLESNNRSAFLESGTLLCFVGDPAEREAVAVIDPGQVEWVHPGQQVMVYLAGGPTTSLTGEVVAISAGNRDASPPELVAAGDLPARPSTNHSSTPVRANYEAVIRLGPSTSAALPGIVGRARIEVAPQSLWARFRRLIGQTLSTVD